MRFIGFFLATIAMGAAGSHAQDTAAPATGVVDSPPAGYPTTGTQPTGMQTYNELRKQELERGVRRTRTALIATSASFAVGLALVVPAFTSDNCVSNDFDNNDLVCTSTGKALLGVGIPFLTVGFYGALVSGIMLGVRKGKLRRLNERIAYESRAKLRWDPTQSKFVF